VTSGAAFAEAAPLLVEFVFLEVQVTAPNASASTITRSENGNFFVMALKWTPLRTLLPYKAIQKSQFSG
jgi:hypothetical protein